MGARFERILAVFGAALILVVGLDAVTYAATGKVFGLGQVNTETKVTAIQNNGSGAALSLHVKKPSTAPFTTNGTGKVANLNADKLDGLTAAQIIQQAASHASVIFNRSGSPSGAVAIGATTYYGAIESAPVGVAGTYSFIGSVNHACDPNFNIQAGYFYTYGVYRVDGATVTPITVVSPSMACGSLQPLPSANVTLTPTSRLLVVAGDNSPAWAPVEDISVVGLAPHSSL